MENTNRDASTGWHQQSSAGSNQSQTASQQASAPSGAPVLPPPSGSSFFPNPPPAHNLPGIAGLTQTSQSHPAQSTQHSTPRTDLSSTHSNQAPSHGFSAINQHQMQGQMDAERDRAREMEELARRNEEQREREMRDRQYREQQPQEPQVIHQPIAVAPNVRSIHGPNGLLGNPDPPAASVTQGQGMFSGAPLAAEANIRVQQPSLAAQSPLVSVATPNGQQGPGAINQAQQPILNDALSYLDQVKVQFADHPDVYNRFLDIMKDFKSGAIDTPGVIERVSQLFSGNSGLIQGFNTFLPPGYKIECGTGEDPNSIRVTTPMGTTICPMPAPRPLSPRVASSNGAMNERALFSGAGWPHQQADLQISPNSRQQLAQPGYGQGLPTSHPAQSPESFREQQGAAATAIHQIEQRNVAQLQSAASAASARDRGALISSPGDTNTPLSQQAMNGISPNAGLVNGNLEKRGPVEFNHAISYVNKIKNRFAQQPDIYKQFLEILQTYQRESKPIQDVYAQVTRLFETAPDLLEDFKQFLPESAASTQNKPNALRAGGEEAFPLSNARNEPIYPGAVAANGPVPTGPIRPDPKLPPMGNFGTTQTVNRDNKRKRGERQGPSITPIAPDVNNLSGLRGALGQPPNNNKRLKQVQAPKPTAPPELSLTKPGLVPTLPTPMPPLTSVTASTDDFAFFDRVRKQIGNKSLWGEFLKLINLYKYDLIDQPFLVFKAQAFIGSNSDLMNQFKEFVHYKGAENRVNNEPAIIHGRVQLSNCRGLGPSYRLLPKAETTRKCSGRDDLCHAVLNDDWVSHPTWASEDSGFVAHRKNAHEEGLHRVEEERHDYDFYIEACRRSIQLLEPIAQLLASSTPETRVGFQLDPKLGGQSETIYRRVVYKIYGREKGNDVIRELFHRPYDVIPTLLARLKTQCEQWKAAQTQWEKVWRVQTEALFYRSLDHQGASTRVGDKRQFFAKQLMNEIQVKYQEHRRQKEMNRVAGVPNYHFSYSCADRNILRDAGGLITLYAEQNYSTEHPTLVRSIKELLGLFFLLDPNELDQDANSQDNDMDIDQQSDEGASPRQRPSNRKGGLLRGVLERGRRRDNDDSAASDNRSRHSTPDEALAEMADVEPLNAGHDGDDSQSAAEKWFNHPIHDNLLNGKNVQPNEPYKRSTYSMYSNAAIYCFMRLFGILVERLENVKANEEEVRDNVARQKGTKAAYELGWISKDPTHFFASTDFNANYYGQLLDMFHKMIRNEIDGLQVEETLRRYYLDNGYHLYTLDKLLGALNKFAMGIFFPDAKEKTPEIYSLFKKDRARGETITHKEEVQYRRAVDRLAREGEIYRIAYDTLDSIMTIQLIKSTDPTFESSLLTRAEAWKVYISSYETIYPTEGIDPTTLYIPFVKRSLRTLLSSDDSTSNLRDSRFTAREGMQFRVSASTYRMEVEPMSTDVVENLSRARAITRQEMNAETEKRSSKVEEQFRANSEWMRGRSKEDVDAKKQAFAEKFNEVIEKRSSRSG